jgi:hypothetical protein
MLEAFFSSRREHIRALEYFLGDRLVDLLKYVGTPFHPFRDFERIKSAYSMMSEIWDDINLVGQAYERERITKLGEKLDELRTMSIESSSKKISH